MNTGNTFDYPEDREYFEDLLRDVGGVAPNMHLFCFVDPDLKRKEFNRVRKLRMAELIEANGPICQLRLHEDSGHLTPVKLSRHRLATGCF